MNLDIKDILRTTLNTLHLDITQNLKYDRLTKQIIKRVLLPDSVCIDVGAHKGKILTLFLKSAPNARHIAFEPIPFLYEELRTRFADRCSVFPFALGDESKETTFQLVKNAPAYSGILKRKYAVKNPDIEEISVLMTTIDYFLITTEKIRLIKIDVEGGEFAVLKGAEQRLRNDKPYVIFECGLGASEYYGTTPTKVYDFLIDEVGLKLSLLDDWLQAKAPLSRNQFCNCYSTSKEYYFLAHPY
jgi:FkbM family methyltransferase